LIDVPYTSQGSKIYGQGFLFDDKDSKASAIRIAKNILEEHPDYALRIRPYLGADEINSDPTQSTSRLVIQLSDIQEEKELDAWPELKQIIIEKVKNERLKLGPNPVNTPLKRRWWAYQAHRPELYSRLSKLRNAIFAPRVTTYLNFVMCDTKKIFSESVICIASSKFSTLGVLQSRVHEIFARFFSSTLGDALRYTASDCLQTFPFPANFEANSSLETAGEIYHSFRAQLMIDRNEGLTETYNRFHARGENAADIARLRALNAELDKSVLRAYVWDDLADRAAPEFIEQEADEGKTPKTRLDWPSEFKDEVLARLLALNATRAAEERAAGLVAADEGEEDFEGEGG
jgi:hypothetical protein